MNFEELLKGLSHPEPAKRLATARIIGLVQETRALEALGSAYRTETIHEVKNAISWAGKRAQEARKASGSTLDIIFKHFHVDYEVENMEDEAERELMNRMKHAADMDIINNQADRANKMITGMALGAALLGTQGVVMGAMAGLTPGAEVLSSGLEPRPQLGKTRTPAAKPADTEIKVQARRLLDDLSADKRRKAAIDLMSINNPAALPYLAQAFVEDMDPGVREAVERAGKQIYLNAIYWQMEQDGSLNDEIKRRALAAGKLKGSQPPTAAETTAGAAAASPPPPPASEPPPAAPMPKIRLADIMRRTDEMRSQRDKKD